MSKKQTHIIFLLIGIFLLALTFYREEWFAQSHIGLWCYRVFAIGGLISIASNFGKLIHKNWSLLFIGLLFLVEIIFAVFFNLIKIGNEMPEKITGFLSYIYLFHCRDYIIYDEDRGQYDPELFYKLKPGDFEYNNMEFATNFHVNNAGFRDDDVSLNFPEIIFLGDSYTMGWGVEQEESFAQILEKKINKKTLNLGIASYGTAREFLAFEKIKHDSAELIILQFCPNDVNENKSFVENNFQLNTSTKEKFEKEIIWNKIYQVYFPLKYVHASFYFFAKKLKPIKNNAPEKKENTTDRISEKEVEYFFQILKKIKNSFNGKIIIFNLGMNITTPAVNNQFKKYLLKNKLDSVYVFPSTEYLNAKDYLPLDTHLTIEGNEKLAMGLNEFILKNNLIK